MKSTLLSGRNYKIMNKNIEKQIERDCVRRMFPCFALHFFREMLELTLPVITSWMIGDMADALLSLDMQRIKGRLAVFIIAFLADVLGTAGCADVGKLSFNPPWLRLRQLYVL